MVLGAGVKTAPMQSIQQLVLAPIPLQCTDDILEIEQEEFLCNNSLRRECGEESVGEEDKDVFSSSDDLEDEVGIYTQ